MATDIQEPSDLPIDASAVPDPQAAHAAEFARLVRTWHAELTEEIEAATAALDEARAAEVAATEARARHELRSSTFVELAAVLAGPRPGAFPSGLAPDLNHRVSAAMKSTAPSPVPVSITVADAERRLSDLQLALVQIRRGMDLLAKPPAEPDMATV